MAQVKKREHATRAIPFNQRKADQDQVNPEVVKNAEVKIQKEINQKGKRSTGATSRPDRSRDLVCKK